MSSSGSPGNKFADYFVICGLEPSSGLEPDKLSGDSLHIQPLDRPYKTQVLAHYPDNVPWNPFDKEAVGMLCCPRGVTFRTQKQQRRPSFHSFLITREDGSRVHGAAYTFYEEVSNHQICAAMQTLHAMHLAELSNSQSRTLYSHLGPAHERSPVQGRRRGTYQTYDISQDKLYCTKCICLISQLPLVSAMRKFLTGLYSMTQNFTAPELPLECYVYNVLHEVPMPPPGRSLKFTCCGRDIMCQRPGVDEMPLLDMPIGEIFRMLGIKNVLAIFTCILLEHQTLLYSSNYHYLMLVAEGLTSLLFPFSWQHVYVPILPASLLHFLDAPVPFIMGLHRGQEDRSDLALPSEANMCFVDIDAGTVELPEDLPTFPQSSDFVEELQSVLSKIGSRYESKDSVFHEDYDSGMSDGSVSSSLTSIPSKMEILAQSEAFTKIAAIAKKSGVINSIEDIELNLDSNKSSKRNSRNDDMDENTRELEDLKFNNAIRQVFLNRFLHIFCHYEHFVIQPVGQSFEIWLGNRESMQNFDKASFLSDQPDTHLPFLAAFIETQMFATLIDNKILSLWEEADLALKIFDGRVTTISEREEGRTPVYHRCMSYENAEGVIEKRVQMIDHIASLPHQLEFMNETRQHQRGVFPILQADVLNREPISNKLKKHENIKWRKKERQAQHVEHVGLKAAQREKFIQEAKSRRVRESKLFDTNPTMVARTNWKFVETLLKECKNKTKRMLVEKMGQEAVDLGHGELSITGVEENTLIASLCDLLERIWSHGLQSKQGKSALWSHLLSYKEVEDSHDTSKAIDPTKLTPGTPLEMSLEDLSATLESSSPLSSPSKTRHRRKNSQSVNLPTLPALATSLTAEMRNVQGMSNVITEAGYARAWIRLSLEKKVLSKHLKELLSDSDLTRSLYKRYAFLRCEDEKEQFLYHMLSLNAVDYKCFTNTFTSTFIPYRVLVFPAKRIGGSICGTTANPWITVAGQLGESPVTPVPKTSWELLLECKNLGMLTTLRIGHDSSGIAPRWLVEHVLIRNEITGHTYKFPCGRWLGKGVDDGSTERLLVGELVPVTTDTEDLLTTCSTPPRCGSPSTPRKSLDGKLTINRIQEMVGDSINNLVKHFYKPEKERGSLTVLLCGEAGIVTCMEHVFQYNFKSSRLLRSKFYLWDYIEKVHAYFETLLREEHKIPVELKSVYKSFCSLVFKINSSTQNIGKDGKFQLLVCLSIRDNLLQKWIPAMADTPVTTTMYEEMSFLRDPELTIFLVHILDSLKEFNITLEASLTKGLDV